MKFGLNPGGPPSKAKYVIATDSELSTVRERRKEPREGSEIEPETVGLQAVKASLRDFDPVAVMACLLKNEPASYGLWQG